MQPSSRSAGRLCSPGKYLHRLQSRSGSVHTLAKFVALLVCVSMVIASFVPPARAGGGRGLFENAQRLAEARGGPPEGKFPNLDEVRRRRQPIPRAPLAIPSTMRSPRNPLMPRNGLRVGDPLAPLEQVIGNNHRSDDKQLDESEQLIAGNAGVSPALAPQRRTMGARAGTAKSLSRFPEQHSKAAESRQKKSPRAGARAHHASSRSGLGLNAPPPLPDDQFLQNFFSWALERSANGTEAQYWNDILRASYAYGQGSIIMGARELGKTLFESSEYAARFQDDHWFVYDLYKTYLMRDPDPGGWAFWEGLVPGFGREAVRRGFDESTEFIDLVNTITPNGSASSAVTSLLAARVEPVNQPGSGLLGRDVDWSVSLLSLPGRAGLDLGLGLSYSSMVWTKSGPYIYFDEDVGFPSPGFRLGFPTIQERFFDAQVRVNAYLLQTASGRRVELRQVGATNVYKAADSSYLQLTDNSGSNNLLVRSTDGTQMSYSRYNNEWRCDQIKDRNGNYL